MLQASRLERCIFIQLFEFTTMTTHTKHKKDTASQATLMQQPFIQATLPFAITEVTPKIAPNPLSAKAEGKIKGKIKDKIKSADRGVDRGVDKDNAQNFSHKHEPEDRQKQKFSSTSNPLKTSTDVEQAKAVVKEGPTQAYADLLKHPQLWRGKDLSKASATHAVASGYNALDDCLAGGGWPHAGLVDFILPHAGIGELRLLLPALTTLAESRWLAWINPPFTPYAPALEAAGIDSNKILLIYTKTHEEMLWAMERTCKSGSCGAVLVWPDERKLSLKETRRVQLAAKQGATLSVLFRPMEASSKASLAELRLVLSPDKSPLHLSVNIIKRRGGWPVKDLVLPVAAVTQSQYTSAHTVRQKLSLWRDKWQEQAVLQEQNNPAKHNLTKVSPDNDSADYSADYIDSYVDSYLDSFAESNSKNTPAPSLH